MVSHCTNYLHDIFAIHLIYLLSTKIYLLFSVFNIFKKSFGFQI